MRWIRVLAYVLVGAAVVAGSWSILIIAVVHQGRKAEQRSQEERLASEVARCMQDLTSGASNEIYLYGMRRTDELLEHFRERTDVRSILLEVTDISDAGMAHIATMPNLEQLALTVADRVGDSGLAAIAGHKRIEKLWLYNTHVSDGGLASLKSLPSLNTLGLNWSQRGERPTDACVVYLKQLTNLKTLIIGGDWISASGIAQIRSALPQCDVKLQGWEPASEDP